MNVDIAKMSKVELMELCLNERRARDNALAVLENTAKSIPVIEQRLAELSAKEATQAKPKQQAKQQAKP